jgi:hypothetical protein
MTLRYLPAAVREAYQAAHYWVNLREFVEMWGIFWLVGVRKLLWALE